MSNVSLALKKKIKGGSITNVTNVTMILGWSTLGVIEPCGEDEWREDSELLNLERESRSWLYIFYYSYSKQFLCPKLFMKLILHN